LSMRETQVHENVGRLDDLNLVGVRG